MKIEFGRIEIHNFMSFADEVFDFSQQTGMNLVTGKNLDVPNSKNGAGKSTVFCALLYGLYGQLPQKIKADHIANRFIKDKEVRVAVWLKVDTVSYKVVTGLNKRAQSYFNLVVIGENGTEQDITKSSIAETRDFFENEILHCDMSLFLRTILLTAEQNYNFFNLNKSSKKEFIEKLFDIGVFGDMYASIHKDILAYDKQIISLQNQLIVLERSADDYTSRSETFIQTKEKQLKEIEQKISSVESELNELSTNAVEKNTDLILKCETSINKLNDAKQKLMLKINESKVAVSKIKQNIAFQQSLKSDRQKVLNKHAELLSKLCADCKPIFAEYHNLDVYKQEVQSAEQKMISFSTELEANTKNQADQTDQLKKIDAKLQELNAKITELTADFKVAKQKQGEAERTLAVLESSKQQIQDKANPYTDLLMKTKEDITKQKTTLETINEHYKYLAKAEEIVSHESLKKFIIKDLIGIINNRIKFYLTKMGAKYTCIFDDNLDYEFVTDSGPCELQNFSCGEKKRLEIATCLAFRDFIAQRSNISSNILAIDEYIDSGIDTLAVESILSILKEFTVINNQNIFIISHRTEVNNDMFDRIIELEKKNGISVIHYLNI